MQLTETKPNPLFVQFLPQTQKEAEQLEKMTRQLKTKHQQLTHLFDQASSALNTIQSLTALVPQTSVEIRAALEALFQSDQCPVTEEIQAIPSHQPQTSSNPLIEVAHQLLPLLKQGTAIANSGVARLMTEALGGSDAEGHWLWKDAYEALEIAQIRFIQEQGKKLLNQANSAVILGEIDRLHRLCPTQTRRSETSIQLQQFSTPLPLAYLVQVAAQITPDDLVLEPSAGTGLLAAFTQIGGAQLLLNEICPKRRDILSEVFPKTPLFGYNAEQIDNYLDLKFHPTVVVMNPPFSASPGIVKRNQFATLKHLRSALARLTEGGCLLYTSDAADE